MTTHQSFLSVHFDSFLRSARECTQLILHGKALYRILLDLGKKQRKINCGHPDYDSPEIIKAREDWKVVDDKHQALKDKCWECERNILDLLRIVEKQQIVVRKRKEQNKKDKIQKKNCLKSMYVDHDGCECPKIIKALDDSNNARHAYKQAKDELRVLEDIISSSKTILNEKGRIWDGTTAIYPVLS
jgi:hypothetical protein